MRKNELLKEAARLHLEAYVTLELGDNVDYRTGELLAGRHYEAYPWASPDLPYPPLFERLSSHKEMQRFLETLDHRRLTLRNDCLRVYDRDKGNAYMKGTRIRFTTVTHRKLSRLVDCLDYRNVILTTPARLARRLRVSCKNLPRHLSSLTPLVRVTGPRQGIQTGSLKVTVNPAYGFKYEAHDFALARQDALQHWCRALMQ